MTRLAVTNPRTGKSDYEIQQASKTEVEQAALDLRDAQARWLEIGITGRCEVMRRWAAVITQNKHVIAEALCVDTGRRVVSHHEVDSFVNKIEHWCSLAPDLLSASQAQPSNMVPSVEYRHHLVPYSLVGIISPWNFPLTLAMIDTIPALLSGACVLLKPSEVTPRFIKPLSDTLQYVEELRDGLKIITGGPETGIALIDNVDTICFTGSVQTGRKVGIQAAKNFIPAFLELGGKDPAIVLKSADIENTTTAILRSAVGMTGQACQSLERVYVHESIIGEFVQTITAKALALKYNWPDIDSGQIGPLIFAEQAAKIDQQLQQAVALGAQVHCGGKVEEHDGGRWIAPTVITHVDHSMTLMTEETFGPIIPIMSFSTTAEALALANDSIYGLSGAIFSCDLNEAEKIAEQMEVGAVSINDGGLTAFVHDSEKNSFKLSGIGGSRMGASGLSRFLRKRVLLTQSAPAVPLSVFSEGQ